MRKFLSWQGEDLTPEYDFTEPTSNVHVVWEKVEVGGRAWKGESDVGTVVLRDEQAETGSSSSLPSNLTATSIAAHNRWQWTENAGSNTMARGWIGPKDYRRNESGLAPDRYREISMSVLDPNAQLQGIIVDANRPSETDVARVQWLLSTYLQGSPRPTTNLTDTYLATGSNTVTLPAQNVSGTPQSVLQEIADFANKQFFVTVDEELFYDGNDSIEYQSGLSISDRIDEINTSGSCAATGSSALYDLDFEELDSMGNYDPVAVYPSGTGSWPRDPLYWSDTNPAGHGGGKCVVWGGIFSTDSANSPLLPAFPGVTYRYHLWARWEGYGITPVSDMLRVVFADVDDIIVGTTSITGSGDVPDAWTEYQADATAPAGTAYMYLECHDGFGPNGYTAAYDDVTVTGIGAGTSGAVFPPIWDVGPAATEDGQQLLSGLRMYYGQGSNTYVHVNHPVTANSYAHYEEAMYAPEDITTAAAATTLANAVLQRRRFEERTINVSIGPLNSDQVGCIKYGQLIQIKARAIAFADDLYFTGRIRQLRWTTPVPGMFFAHLQIGRPIKDVPYGVGNKSGSSAINSHLAQGSNAHPEYVLRSTLTTQGDLPYRGASDWTRLGIGASNTHLVSDGASPLWASQSSGSGMTNPMTTIGDLIRGGTAGAPTRLAVGGSNTHLTSDGSLPVWAPVPTSSGGSVTREYLGYNTVGASSESTNTNRVYLKKISVTNACDLLSVQVYVNGQSGSNITGIGAGLWSDSSGSPLTLLAKFLPENHFEVLFQGASTGADRWLAMPLNYELAASTDYWVGFIAADPDFSFRKDGSGGDRYFTAGGLWLTDAGYTTVTTTTDKYSIRARVIR